MSVAKVIINSISADYSSVEDVTLAITRENAQVVDPLTAKVDFTYRFRLPTTQRNRQILGVLAGAQNNQFFVNNKNLNAQIWSDDNLLIDGQLTVLSATEDYFECYIVSREKFWVDLLKDRKLNEIPATRELDFAGWDSSVAAHDTIYKILTDTDLLSPTHNEKYDVVFLNTRYNTQFIPNKNSTGNSILLTSYQKNTLFGPLTFEVAGSDYYYTSLYSNDGQNYISFYDLIPSFYLSNLIRNSFRLAGYNVISSLLDDVEFCKIVLSYSSSRNIKYNWGRMGYTDMERNNGNAGQEKTFGILSIPTSQFYYDYRPSGSPPLPAPGAIVYRHIIRYDDINFDYGFRAIHNNINSSYSTIPSERTNTQYIVPATGWYKIKPTFERISFAYASSGAIGVLDGRAFAFVSRAKSQSNLNEKEQFCDAEISDGLPFAPTRRNIENFICGTSVLIDQVYNPNDFFENDAKFDGFASENVMKVDVVGNDCNFLCYLQQGDIIYAGISVISTNVDFAAPTHNFNMNFNSQLIIEPVGEGTNPYQYDIITLSWNNSPQPDFKPFSTTLNYYTSLRDISVLDFIKSCINQFNLRVSTDVSNKIVYIEKNDNFYGNENNSYDLSKKLNINDATFTENDLYSSIILKYDRDDNNILTQTITNENGVEINNFSDFIYTFDNVQTSDIKIIENIFCPGTFRQYRNISSLVNPIVSTAEFENQDFSLFASNPALVLPTLITQEQFDAFQNNVELTSFDYKFHMYKLNSYEANVLYQYYRWFDESQAAANCGRDVVTTNYFDYVSTNFVDESASGPSQIISLSYNGANNLFIYTYANEISEYQNALIVDVDVYLTAYDFTQLTLDKLVKINDMYFKILKISEFTPGVEKMTAMKLLRVK